MDFSKITIKQVVGGLIAIAILSLISYLIYIHFKSESERNDMIDLGNEDSLSPNGESGAGGVISKIPPSERAKAQAALKNFKPIPIANKIYNALGSIQDDDENAIYSAFGMLKNKLELAELNVYFKLAYKVNLFDFLQAHLDSSELSKIYNIVSKLKNY